MGTGVVDPRLEKARVLLRRIQQLHRIIVPSQRVNDQQRADGERNIDRARNVEHALVTIGILHPNFKNARPTIRVIAAVAVDLDVVGQQLDGFPLEAVNRFIHLIPPV